MGGGNFGLTVGGIQLATKNFGYSGCFTVLRENRSGLEGLAYNGRPRTFRRTAGGKIFRVYSAAHMWREHFHFTVLVTVGSGNRPYIGSLQGAAKQNLGSWWGANSGPLDCFRLTVRCSQRFPNFSLLAVVVAYRGREKPG